jgi:hypothetical protein
MTEFDVMGKIWNKTAVSISHKRWLVVVMISATMQKWWRKKIAFQNAFAEI